MNQNCHCVALSWWFSFYQCTLTHCAVHSHLLFTYLECKLLLFLFWFVFWMDTLFRRDARKNKVLRAGVVAVWGPKRRQAEVRRRRRWQATAPQIKCSGAWGGGGCGQVLFLVRPAVCPGVKMCTHSGGRGGPAPNGNTLKVQWVRRQHPLLPSTHTASSVTVLRCSRVQLAGENQSREDVCLV